MAIKKRDTFSLFLKSYFYIVLLASLFFSAINIQSIYKIHSQLEESYLAMGNQAASYLETNLYEINRLAELISKDYKFTPYFIMENVGYPHNITYEINKLKSYRNILSSVGIVYRNSVFDELNFKIFTSNGTYSIDRYCDIECGGKIDRRTFTGAIRNVDSPMFLTNHSSVNGSGAETKLIYVIPLPGDYSASPAVILFNLNYKELQRNIKNAVGDMSNVVVFYNKDLPILSTNSNGKNAFDTMGLDYNSRRSISKNYVVNEFELLFGINIVQIIDRKGFYAPLYQSINSFLILFASCLAFNLFLSYRFAKINSTPIQNLAKKAADTFENPIASNKSNEIEFLDRTLDWLKSEKQKMSEQMSSERLLVTNHLLLALLNGKEYSGINNSYAHDFLKDVNNEDFRFCSIVFLIDKYAAFIESIPSKEQWLIKYSLCNIFEEACRRFGDGYGTDLALNEGIVGIVKFHKAENILAIAQNICEELQAYMKRFDCTLSCSVGTPCDNMFSVSASYSTAISNAHYRFFLGQGSVITPEAVKTIKIKQNNTLKDMDLKWSNVIASIKSCDMDAIAKSVGSSFQCLDMDKNMISFRSAYFRMISLLNSFIHDYLLYKKEALNYKLDMLFERDYETIDDACSGITDFCCELSEEFRQLKGSKTNKDIFALVNKFVLKNYTDRSLTLSKIADELSFNPSYLTRVFKAKSGMSLMQYIDKFRFEKAKDLLIKSEHPIKEIVTMVGYIDEANFLRKFKKTEGISPSMYREMHKNRAPDV